MNYFMNFLVNNFKNAFMKSGLVFGALLFGTFASAAPGAGSPSNQKPGIRSPEPFVPSSSDNTDKLPADIYADYFEAKNIWATQQVAKFEVQKFVVEQKKALADELKVIEGVINTEGPALSEDGNVCTAYSIDSSHLSTPTLEKISPLMEAMAKKLNSKNQSPIEDLSLPRLIIVPQQQLKAPWCNCYLLVSRQILYNVDNKGITMNSYIHPFMHME